MIDCMEVGKNMKVHEIPCHIHNDYLVPRIQSSRIFFMLKNVMQFRNDSPDVDTLS